MSMGGTLWQLVFFKAVPTGKHHPIMDSQFLQEAAKAERADKWETSIHWYFWSWVWNEKRWPDGICLKFWKETYKYSIGKHYILFTIFHYFHIPCTRSHDLNRVYTLLWGSRYFILSFGMNFHGFSHPRWHQSYLQQVRDRSWGMPTFCRLSCLSFGMDRCPVGNCL